MESLTLQPIARVEGTVNLPGSKSVSNRALLLAALARFYVTTDYSAAASAFGSARSTSSMYAIGALSPARKPHFRMRV